MQNERKEAQKELVEVASKLNLEALKRVNDIATGMFLVQEDEHIHKTKGMTNNENRV